MATNRPVPESKSSILSGGHELDLRLLWMAQYISTCFPDIPEGNKFNSPKHLFLCLLLRILDNPYNSKICTLCLTYRCSRLFFQRKQKTVSRVLGREESVQVTILSKHL